MLAEPLPHPHPPAQCYPNDGYTATLDGTPYTSNTYDCLAGYDMSSGPARCNTSSRCAGFYVQFFPSAGGLVETCLLSNASLSSDNTFDPTCVYAKV